MKLSAGSHVEEVADSQVQLPGATRDHTQRCDGWRAARPEVDPGEVTTWSRSSRKSGRLRTRTSASGRWGLPAPSAAGQNRTGRGLMSRSARPSRRRRTPDPVAGALWLARADRGRVSTRRNDTIAPRVVPPRAWLAHGHGPWV